MNQLFSIGYSGMRVAQMQLNISALNTANLATPGFNRQRVEQMAMGPMGQSRFDTGSGVEVTSIRRMADQFLIKEVWRANSNGNFYASAQGQLSQLETIIGSESAGLGSGLDNLFAALSGATEKPENQAMRQDVLTNARQLCARFNQLQTFVNKQRADIGAKQQSTVASINVLSDNIASFNKKIAESEAQGSDTSILRDQRDELVKELSSYVDVDVNESADGTYTVSLAAGQPLVSGSTAGELAMTPDANGDMHMSLVFSESSFNVDMDCGASLGGLYEYSSNTLDQIETSIKGMAQSLADTFNAVQHGGFDLNGDAGVDLFVFDANNPDGMLQMADISWEQLAFSSDPDANGNNENLKKLIEIGNQTMAIPGMGNTTLAAASASLASDVGLKSRENQAELDAAATLLMQAENNRSNYSGVSEDEEAINLLIYTKAYQSNMKIIATGDQIFNDLLALF